MRHTWKRLLPSMVIGCIGPFIASTWFISAEPTPNERGLMALLMFAWLSWSQRLMADLEKS